MNNETIQRLVTEHKGAFTRLKRDLMRAKQRDRRDPTPEEYSVYGDDWNWAVGFIDGWLDGLAFGVGEEPLDR